MKAKLAQKTNASSRSRKDTKEQAKQKEKEKAEAEAKEKAEKEAKELKEKARQKAAAAQPIPGPWADERDEASQIGIHLGISCDGCGRSPPLIGRAMKCKDCPDFDLCDECFPQRLDKAREAVAAAAGMPGKGRHPAAHQFGPRKASSVLTKEAVAAELAAEKESEKVAAAKAAARSQRQAEGPANVVEEVETRTSFAETSPVFAAVGADSIWRPSPKNAELLPTPMGPPRVLRPAL